MSESANERSAGPVGSAFVRVAAVAPFWRYAVGPTSAHSPAIPCYTLKEAEKLFAEVQRELPWAGAILYKRVWFRGIETLREYRPNSSRQTPTAEVGSLDGVVGGKDGGSQ